MDVYTFVIQNKESFKLVYALFIILVCSVIVLRTNKLFHLSMHPGIRYFRNAFLFYGLAFFSRYILHYVLNMNITSFLFEFFVVTAGFFLLYSLLWKKASSDWELSSIFNWKFLIVYLMAIIIPILDLIWSTTYFVLVSQTILFFIASIVSFAKFIKRKKNAKFSGFHFIAMVIMFVAWALNTVAPEIFSWNPAAIVNIYLLNAVFFLVFLFGVVKISQR